MKARLHTSVREDAHSYTRSKCPWILAGGEPEAGRLAHYLSGGGSKAFGRTVRQEEIRRRHAGFWTAAAALFALWFCFLVF